MNERVTCRGQQYSLLPEGYWHLADPSGLVLNNAFVSEGICRSVFAVNRMPGLAKAVSPYGLRSMQDKKEQCWETARQSENDNLPSRIGAVFLLESEELAKKLSALWFGAEQRIQLRARVIAGSRLHTADARWLDCTEESWNEHATRYWRGDMSDDPLPEVLVDGIVYFPDWRESPFGVGAGLVPR